MSYDSLAPETVSRNTKGNWVFDVENRLIPFKAEDIKFTEGVQQAYGGMKVEVQHGGEELRFLTPPMQLPFGLTEYNNKRGKSLVLELSFGDLEKTHPATGDFYRAIRILDAEVLKTIIANRQKYFPTLRRYKDSELWKQYNAATRLRESKAGMVYPPRLTVKVWPQTSVIFGMDKAKRGALEYTVAPNRENIPRDTFMTCLVKCTGLWIGKDNATLGFSLIQGRIVDPPAGMEPKTAPTHAVCIMPTQPMPDLSL